MAGPFTGCSRAVSGRKSEQHESSLILVSVQGEANDPKPSANAFDPLGIPGEAR